MEAGVVQLDDYQKAYLDSCKARAESQEPWSFTTFTFAEAEPARRMEITAGTLRVGRDLYFVTTITKPVTTHQHQFIGVFDTNSGIVAEALAGLGHYDRMVAPLGEDHTVELGKHSPLRRHLAGMITLGGRMLPGFEDKIRTERGVETAVFQVVFLTTAELNIKREGGLDALFELWTQTRRRVMHVEIPELL